MDDLSGYFEVFFSVVVSGAAREKSCKAGLVVAALARGDGASDALHGGFVTYTKAKKMQSHGVSAKLLERTGSVTAEVADAMVKGALERSPAAIALSVTGVLGPTCDEDGNPVGLIISCGRRNRKPNAIKCDFGRRSHDILRRKAVLSALEMLRRCSRRN